MQFIEVPNTGDIKLRFRKGKGGGESVLLELIKTKSEGEEFAIIREGSVERGGTGGGVEKS